MKKIIIGFGLMLGLSSVAQATPLDLGTFSTDSASAGIYGDMMAFDETDGLYSRYFSDDNFQVAANVVSLSFDYLLNVGTVSNGDENEDYLVFVLDYADYLIEEGDLNTSTTDILSFSGSYTLDLAAFQGQTISLSFGMEGGWDDYGLSSMGNFSNFDIQTAPVPEPATMLLFGTGIAGLIGARRRKATKG